MKKCIIYSLSIYIIIYIALISKKPFVLYDNINGFKSLLYFQNKLYNGYTNYDELICLPTIMLLIVFFSFLLAKNLSK